MKTVVTKAEYAARKGRAPSCVSNWIAAGKITADALVGEGTRAKIWVEQADRDLEASLDVGQQHAQDKPAFEGVVGRNPLKSHGDGSPLVSERQARAEKMQHEAALAQLRVEKEAGRWIDAEQAQRAWGRELARVIGDLETFVAGQMARQLAEAHGLDPKAIAVEIRDLLRAHRAAAAVAATEELSRHSTQLVQTE